MGLLSTELQGAGRFEQGRGDPGWENGKLRVKREGEVWVEESRD